MATNINLKQLKIDHNQRVSMIAVSILMTVLIFTFFFVRKFYTDYVYQGQVITEQNNIFKEIKQNQTQLDTLEQSFKTFDSKKPGLLGKNQPANISNGVIVLRALPQKFDQQTALEMQIMFRSFMEAHNYEGSVTLGASPAPAGSEGGGSVESQEIPVTMTVQEMTPNRLKQLVSDLDDMIQPVKILNIAVTQGETDDGQMAVTLGLQLNIQSDSNVEFKTVTIKRDGKPVDGPYTGTTDAPATNNANGSGEEEEE